MKVDYCQMSACMSLTAPEGPNEFLNINSPLQIGGTLMKLDQLAESFKWDHRPTDKGFSGCIRNMTINGNVSFITSRFSGFRYLKSDLLNFVIETIYN